MPDDTGSPTHHPHKEESNEHEVRSHPRPCLKRLLLAIALALDSQAYARRDLPAQGAFGRARSFV
jgi:hypothetical protein